MNKLTVTMAALVLTMTTVVKAGNGTKYNVNTDKSSVAWKAEKVTGTHNGLVKLKSGSMEVNNGKVTGGEFVIDMTTISCLDLEDPGYNKKLVDHLKSDDFFGVEKHPTAKLVIKQVIPQGKDSYKMVGDLTIKGITKEVKFLSTVNVTGSELNGKAEITIDRTEYNVRYGSGSFFDDLGDKTIYDNFTLNVSLAAKS